ncbi:MAG: hypothetical protein SV201_15985 [Pseudomonadota bacterium]|nr:hypothetical protein [Pseudomonadota bacterium]
MNRIWIVFCALLWTAISTAEPVYLPEPPFFGTGTDPEKVLQDYPLGVITSQAAFAHHGAPEKKISLVNGKEGWVYTVGYARDRKTYQQPSGETKRVEETDWALGVRSFTLVFDDEVVIDVIYKDDGSGIGVTAMELQHPRPQRRKNP